jgi:phospholipase C
VSLLPGVDQLVIVMLENRSFDSMLGYLSLDQWKNARNAPVLSPRLAGDSTCSAAARRSRSVGRSSKPV